MTPSDDKFIMIPHAWFDWFLFPPAVAVSGGCDSLALTFLTTKVFDSVVGLVVDHK